MAHKIRFTTKKDILLPKRDPFGKKGDNGRLLCVGGSEEYVGAIALAGLAALRCGVDWVTIAAPEKTAWAINCLSPDLITIKLKGDHLKDSHYKKISELAGKHTVLLMGNGMGLRPDTSKLIQKLNKLPMQKVIDADAIKSLSLQELRNSIITPHSKELEILLENSRIRGKEIKKISNKRSIQKKAMLLKKTIEDSTPFFVNNNVLVLKGPIDIVLSKENIRLDPLGNAGLTKAGTGDVLAGLAAGFLGQTNDLEQSAINATYFIGLIGNILTKRKRGFTYLASDMVEEIRRVRDLLK